MTEETPSRRRARGAWGTIQKLPSGRYRARYTGPDRQLYFGPTTFRTKTEARSWLDKQRAAISSGTWLTPAEAAEKEARERAERERKSVTVGEYADRWVEHRTGAKGQPLSPRTRSEYFRLLRPAGTRNEEDPGGPLADLVDIPIGDLRPEDVRVWRTAQLELGAISQTSRAYDLLKSVLKTAVEDELIDKNPCNIRGGSSAVTGKIVEPPTDEELAIILETINPAYRALVAICANGGLRFGEATALRAKDLNVERDSSGAVMCVRLKVSRGVVFADGERYERSTKNGDARALPIYGDDAEAIAELVQNKIGNALVFTSVLGTEHLPQTTFFRHWDKARKAAGRPDMPFHALRHYAGTRYSQAGATVKETMARLGHRTERAAMRYQHAGNRDDELAMRMARGKRADVDGGTEAHVRAEVQGA